MVKKTFDHKQLIQPNTFIKVKGNGLESDELYAGDLLYVANLKALPFDENDLYLQRLYISGHRAMKSGKIDTSEVLIVDPRNFDKVTPARNKRLLAKMEAYYSDLAAKNEGE